MLKYISITMLLTLSLSTHASEYLVHIKDLNTNEVQVEKCLNEQELSNVTNYLLATQDSNIQFKVKKLPLVSVDRHGGGEGGTD
jgi:hypothetical protein